MKKVNLISLSKNELLQLKGGTNDNDCCCCSCACNCPDTAKQSSLMEGNNTTNKGGKGIKPVEAPKDSIK